MGQNELIVSLKKIGDKEEISLEKQVEGCEKKTLEKVLEYMLDSEGDEFNPPYDPEQRDLAQRIDEARRTIQEGYEAFTLSYEDEKGDLSSPINNLDRKVSDFPDAIGTRVRITSEGEEITYKGIDLQAEITTYGGDK